MPFRRDSEGRVIMEGVSDDTSGYPYFTDLLRGKARTAFLNLNKEQSKLPMMETIRRANNPVRNIRASLDEHLILHETDQADGSVVGCPNSVERLETWVTMSSFEVKAVDPDAPFLNRLAYLCRQAGVRSCRNRQCLDNKRVVERFVPQCEWLRFREWAVAISACRMSFTPEQQATRAYFHLNAAVLAGHALLEEHRTDGKDVTGVLRGNGEDQSTNIDVFGVCEVVYWMLTTLDQDLSTPIDGKWGSGFLPPDITAAAVDQAGLEARELGICPKRLWDLALVSERKEVDLPGFVKTALNHPGLRHDGHAGCTSGFCSISSLDSTKIKQLHKCPPEDRAACESKDRYWFDPNLLNESMKSPNGRTVWTIDQPFQVSQTKSYVAISHVWSDGTGVGLHTTGSVNACLFDYFSGMIRTLRHDGIWWDTISIPSDRETRAKAINAMHNNYANAAATLVHDEYLANYQWAEDGGPCIALTFSPWFTRGWTALELIMSKVVKVIFRGADGGPVIKDLDQDILARDPYRCTHAHWTASGIIRRLRQQDIRSVSDLLAILKPRTTSWERDRMIIAALLCGLDNLGYDMRQDDITKAIINKVYRLDHSSLFHGKVTIAESGGWSWCPSSLYDLPIETKGDLLHNAHDKGESDELIVDGDGVLIGGWHHRPLECVEVEKGHIVSNSADLSVIRRTKDALRRWENCLLLRESNRSGPGLGLLVIAVGKRKESVDRCHTDYIQAKFIGTVHQIGQTQEEGWDPRFNYNHFRIGEAPQGSEMRASKFVVKENSNIPPKEDFKWLRGKLWMGDRSMGELMVVRLQPDGRTSEAFALQANEKPGSKRPAPTDRQVICYDHEVSLAPKPIFSVKSHPRRGPDGKSVKILKRVYPDQSWPPSSIPATDRVRYSKPLAQPDDVWASLSTELFHLKVNNWWVPYAALDRNLLTPDATKPYQGVWVVFQPVFGLQFLLLHHPTKYQLEAIKLTGDMVGPRGMVSFVVDDLVNDVKSCKEGEGNLEGLPAVPAKVFIAEKSADKGEITPAQLVVVSDQELVLVMENAILWVKRVDLGKFIS